MSATQDKGLINSLGENNCFLNVVIQSLWHLSIFRSRFFEWNVHKCDRSQDAKESTCVHCALTYQWIFSYYSDPESSLIPPKLLRQTLNNVFRDQNRFQMGDIDDAAEALEAVLSCLHDNTREEDGEESCVAHGIFGINTLNLLVCSQCQETSEPTPNLHFLEYAYENVLRSQHNKFPEYSFEKLVYTTNQEYKGCPKEDNQNPCGNVQNIVERHLLNIPGVIAFGLVWPTSTPSVENIMETLEIIQHRITLDELYCLSSPEQRDVSYRFRGMICYYGKHYNAYFYNESTCQWIVFDDATVKQVGAHWDDVLTRCRRGHFHPSVLFYEKNGQNEPKEQQQEKIIDKQEEESISGVLGDLQQNMEYNTLSNIHKDSEEEKKLAFARGLSAEHQNVRGGIPPSYKRVCFPLFRKPSTISIPRYTQHLRD